jgi:hypothetical protein
VKIQNKKKSIYDPIKEQLRIVLEYIDILEYKRPVEPLDYEIFNLLSFLDYAKRQCDFYLNYEVLKRKRVKDNDRSFKI